MSTISRDEFIAKYGDVKVQFSTYYKYSFTFDGKLDDGNLISVTVGGHSDSIYRMEVAVEELVPVSDLYPYSGSVTCNGTVIEKFYDYD